MESMKELEVAFQDRPIKRKIVGRKPTRICGDDNSRVNKRDSINDGADDDDVEIEKTRPITFLPGDKDENNNLLTKTMRGLNLLVRWDATCNPNEVEGDEHDQPLPRLSCLRLELEFIKGAPNHIYVLLSHFLDLIGKYQLAIQLRKERTRVHKGSI
ncbi:hypothetical protein ACFE04_027641 [Oxalis oulophora]